MYSIGDRVMYGIHGVCEITDMEQRCVDRRRIMYFVLEPLDQTGARFLVPSENEAALRKLRRIMSREELDAMLSSDAVREDAWIADENQRKQHYRELITSGDRLSLLRMVRTLHQHKQHQAAAGRKFHLCDDNFLRDAEKLLSAEFSLILGIQPEQVGEYILSALEK